MLRKVWDKQVHTSGLPQEHGEHLEGGNVSASTSFTYIPLVTTLVHPIVDTTVKRVYNPPTSVEDETLFAHLASTKRPVKKLSGVGAG